MSTWSIASESSTGPVIYPPTASILDSVHEAAAMSASTEEKNQIDSSAVGTTSPEFKGPDTALAIFRYEFTTLPRGERPDFFTLRDHPMEWPTIVELETDKSYLRIDKASISWMTKESLRQFLDDDTHDRASTSLEAISREENSAVKLLLVIFWSSIMTDREDNVYSLAVFWKWVGKFAGQLLFQFYGAPEQYIGCIQNVKRTKKGILEGIVSDNGEKFFLVTSEDGLKWLSDMEGLERAKNVIGELPTLKLELI